MGNPLIFHENQIAVQKKTAQHHLLAVFLNRVTLTGIEPDHLYLYRNRYLRRLRTRTGFCKKIPQIPYSNGKSFNFSLESNRSADKNRSTSSVGGS